MLLKGKCTTTITWSALPNGEAKSTIIPPSRLILGKAQDEAAKSVAAGQQPRETPVAHAGSVRRSGGCGSSCHGSSGSVEHVCCCY